LNRPSFVDTSKPHDEAIRRCDEHPALPRRTQKIEAVKHITERGLRVADLRELGESCMEGLCSQAGYRRRPRFCRGKPTVASPNRLEGQFNVSEPNKFWVTYIRTYEGWLYPAVELDLFSRQVVDWSMRSRMCRDLAIVTLRMAVWRCKPKQEVSRYRTRVCLIT